MDEVKLKPCPFCGAIEVTAGQVFNQEHVIFCENCFAQSSQRSTIERASASWNSRSLPDEVRALVLAAREAHRVLIQAHMMNDLERHAKACGRKVWDALAPFKEVK